MNRLRVVLLVLTLVGMLGCPLFSPDPVISLIIADVDEGLKLTWSNPLQRDFEGVLIVRSAGGIGVNGGTITLGVAEAVYPGKAALHSMLDPVAALREQKRVTK